MIALKKARKNAVKIQIPIDTPTESKFGDIADDIQGRRGTREKGRKLRGYGGRRERDEKERPQREKTEEDIDRPQRQEALQ